MTDLAADVAANLRGRAQGRERVPSPAVLQRALSVRYVSILAFAITIAVMFAYRPLSQMLRGDPALYDYIAQSILRGQLPYFDSIHRLQSSLRPGFRRGWLCRELQHGLVLPSQ